jgi:ClpP class serine protease
METELKTYSSDMLDLAAVPSEEWHKAKYIEAKASENELIDEIIDLKRQLNAMVRLADYSASCKYPQQEADEDLHTELVIAGYGGDEVPE